MKKVDQFDTDGFYMQTFDSRKEAGLYLVEMLTKIYVPRLKIAKASVMASGISQCCGGRVNSFKGYKWSYTTNKET